MTKPTTPALRRRHTLRNLVFLMLCLLALIVLWGFPYFTKNQALWALKKQNFFENSRCCSVRRRKTGPITIFWATSL